MHVCFLHALPFGGRMWRAERDLLGGRTSAPDLYRRGATLGEWATAVLDDVPSGEPLVVVGCSVGGSCALEVARAAPDRVAALVLVGTKPGVRPDPALRDEAVRVLAERGLEAAWRAYWRPLFGRTTPAGTLAAARRLVRDDDVDDVIRGVRAFHEREDRTDVVRTWRKPLVVVNGGEDSAPPPATGAATVASARRARPRRFHRVAGAGHYVNLERPAALRSIVSDLVRELDVRG